MLIRDKDAKLVAAALIAVYHSAGARVPAFIVQAARDWAISNEGQGDERDLLMSAAYRVLTADEGTLQ